MWLPLENSVGKGSCTDTGIERKKGFAFIADGINAAGCFYY